MQILPFKIEIRIHLLGKNPDPSIEKYISEQIEKSN